MSKYFFTVDTQATFKTEIEEYIALPGSLDIKFVKPAMLTAQRDYIKPLLGTGFYNELLAATTPDAAQIAAIAAIREPLAHLTVINALPHLNVKVGQGGITQNNVNNETAAPWWTVRDQKRELQKNANNAMARLVEFLAENAATYATYASSPARARNLRNFCNDFDTARLVLPKVTSHYIFEQMRAAMTRVDETILLPALGPQLYAYLKTLTLAGTAWAAYAPLQILIQRAELSFAFSEAALESTIQWSPDFGIHVPLISESETGRRAEATTISEREQIVRSHAAKGREAISAIKDDITANILTYTEYVAPVIPVKTYVNNTDHPGGTYFGIGLNPHK